MRSRPSYGDDEARDLGIDVERHMGDRRSWNMSFDGQGRISDGVGTQDNDEAQQCLKQSRWVMKFNHNIPKVHTSSAAVDVFGPYA